MTAPARPLAGDRRAPRRVRAPDPPRTSRIGILLLLWPTLTGFGSPPGPPSVELILIFTVARSYALRGCAVNDWAAALDAHVKRTASRPLATGEIAPWRRWPWRRPRAPGVLMILPVNRTRSCCRCAPVIAFAYPFFKRSSRCRSVLGIAFSFGIRCVRRGAGCGAAARLVAAAPHLFWVIAYDPSTRWSTGTTTCALGSRPRRSRSGVTTSRRDDLHAIYIAGMAWSGALRGFARSTTRARARRGHAAGPVAAAGCVRCVARVLSATKPG